MLNSKCRRIRFISRGSITLWQIIGILFWDVSNPYYNLNYNWTLNGMFKILIYVRRSSREKKSFFSFPPLPHLCWKYKHSKGQFGQNIRIFNRKNYNFILQNKNQHSDHNIWWKTEQRTWWILYKMIIVSIKQLLVLQY